MDSKKSELKRFCPTHLDRSILPCKTGKHLIVQLRKRVGLPQQNEILIFQDADYQCRHCNTWCKSPRLVRRKNTVQDMPLSYDPFKALLVDWYCACSKRNTYSGRFYGIFPLSRNFAFGTDLMYTLVHLNSRVVVPFRSAYKITLSISRMSWGLMYFSREEARKETRMKRRLGYAAFSRFILTVNVDHYDTPGLLFSCNKCETPLRDEERSMLGLSFELPSDLKR